MREILFRGKRANNGEWVEGAYLDKNNIGIFHFDTEYQDYDITVYSVIPESVGQFTGLTDKNGKKIFEWDICLVPTSIEYQRGVVLYDSLTASYFISGKGFKVDFYNCFGRDCEVIGNIHDNPELLKGGEGNG